MICVPNYVCTFDFILHKAFIQPQTLQQNQKETKGLCISISVSFWFCWRVCGCMNTFDRQAEHKKELDNYPCSHSIFSRYVSLAGIQNMRVEKENESCLCESKCKRVSYWKSRVYIVKPCHVISFKHTIYFVRDEIKGADIVGSIYHMTSLTNRFLKLISLPTSTILFWEQVKQDPIL